MKNKEREYRSVTFNTPSDDSRVIGGMIPYNSPSEDMGFIETLDPHCFDRTLTESKDITCLYQHDENRPLARTKNGSLRFNNTPEGLEFEFDVPDTTDGNDLLTMVRSGLISGCSFGFIKCRDSWKAENGHDCRTILEARLLHVSPVTTPAYEGSSVYCRSLSEALAEKELDDTDKEAIRAEMEKLQSMLDNKPTMEEPKSEEPVLAAPPEVNEMPPEDTAEQPKSEELVAPPQENEDQKEFDMLMERLRAAEEIIKSCRQKYCH